MQTSLFNLNNRCQVTLRGGALAVKTPYDPAFVAVIKQLPANDRRFDPTDKSWLVDVRYAREIERWISAYFGEAVQMPSAPVGAPKSEMRICEVHYLGACKERDGESSALGCDANTNWLYIFPERILRNYFDGTEENAAPTREKTLYGALGVMRGVSDEDLRTAYRRMAKTWHPDVCREPNAREVFLRVQEAYEILSNPRKKAQYEAGLALEATLGNQVAQTAAMSTYRAPLRCGQIMAEGIEVVGRFKVSKILVWQDIFNAYGQVLVSSWPMGAKEPVEVWA